MSESNFLPMETNPYGVAPATNVSLAEQNRHDSGNALAANSEARAVAEVKAQVLMARQFPRDPRASMERILRECDRPSLAEQATYSFPRAKETVTGPSIRLAEMLARNWGNCTFGMEVLDRRKDEYGVGQSIIRAFAWDLETNTYISRQFELKHWRQTRAGGYKITDDRDIYELEANMASRRMRACILQMLPGDVTQSAVDKCRLTLSGALSEMMKDPAQKRNMMIKTAKVFEKMGISKADLEVYLGVKFDDWGADQALKLKEVKNSLDDGIQSIGDIFPHLASENQNATITREQAEELMKLAASTGKQGDISKALKEAGIARIAATPAGDYENVKLLIEAYAPAKVDATDERVRDD
jgi:hypothetical protein